MHIDNDTSSAFREALFSPWVIFPLMAAFVIGIMYTSRALSKPKINQIRTGMSIQEIEAVLGEPVDGKERPARPQLRVYRGDGDEWIHIFFKEGIAVNISHAAPRRRFPGF